MLLLAIYLSAQPATHIVYKAAWRHAHIQAELHCEKMSMLKLKTINLQLEMIK